MRLELVLIQENAHRHALYDLDPVTRGVLRRQQCERVAAAGGDANHVAVIGHIATVKVGMHGHRLSRAHALDLHFFEIASTHTSSSGTTASRGVPAATRCPTCTERFAITPLTGETSSVRCNASAALRTAAAAA